MRRLAGGRVFTNYRDEAWQASLFRVALIAVLAGSLAAGPAVLRVAFGGGWLPYLIPTAVIFGAVAVLSTTLLGRPTWRDRRGSAFRLGEVVLLLLATRVLVWALSEGFPQLAQLPQWLVHPGLFFSGTFMFTAVVLLFVWAIAITVTADFLELAIQADEVAARYSHEWGDSKSQWRAARPMGRSEVLQQFAFRWIGLGILLVVCAGMTRLDASFGQSGSVHLALGGLGLRPEVVASLVCYFLAGLLLLSHGRLAVLRGRWFNQEVEVPNTFQRRWHANSLVFVVLIALIALLLPLGTTGWFVGAVEWVIAFFARLTLGIALLLGLIISFLASLLSSLFGTPMPPAEEAAAPPPPVIPTQAEMTSQLPAWLGGAVLWLVIALVAGFLLLNFLRTTGIMEGKFGRTILQWRLWWRARRARFNLAITQRLSGVRRRLRRARNRVAPPARGTRTTGPLLPRDKVRGYYLRAVKEAGEEGVQRPPHKTPLEFAEDLRSTWPETEGDVNELTDAFLDARYSQHEIGDQEVSGAESAWRRLVRGLRGARPRGPDANP